MLLQGSHVLLTGATGSIGAPLAAELARRGARLTLVARSLRPLRDLAGAVGGTALAADLADTSALEALVHRATERSGPVDVVVHNAAVEVLGDLVDADPEDLRGALTLNLGAPLELTRLLLPGMLRRGSGHVVAISSLAGVATFPGLTTYGATKAGLTQAMSGLRAELRGTGVGTTTAELGPVESAMMGRIGGHPPTARAFARVRRLGVLPTVTPERVAGVVVDAVVRDRVHVRLPRRAAPLAAVAGAPRAVVRAALTGTPSATAAARGEALARLSVVRAGGGASTGATGAAAAHPGAAR